MYKGCMMKLKNIYVIFFYRPYLPAKTFISSWRIY
jgi:hypothetical protein